MSDNVYVTNVSSTPRYVDGVRVEPDETVEVDGDSVEASAYLEVENVEEPNDQEEDLENGGE